MPSDLPQIIADEIRAEWGTANGPRVTDEVVNAVTDRLAARQDLRTKDNWRWALRNCVHDVYVNLRNRARPSAADIDRRMQAADQHALPGWDELLNWPIKFDDGTELPAAFATLAQLDFGAGDYLKRGRENTTKGLFLAALRDAMRAAGFQPSQTVEDFYKQQAA